MAVAALSTNGDFVDGSSSLGKIGGQSKKSNEDPEPMLHLAEKDQKKLLMDEISNLKRIISQKEEKIRKLKMAEIYSKKDDLCNLSELTAKWRHASQVIVTDLQSALPDPKPSIPELLKSYQIDFNLIRYNEDEECFT